MGTFTRFSGGWRLGVGSLGGSRSSCLFHKSVLVVVAAGSVLLWRMCEDKKQILHSHTPLLFAAYHLILLMSRLSHVGNVLQAQIGNLRKGSASFGAGLRGAKRRPSSTYFV